MVAKTYFSRDYEEARQRFLDRAGAAGAALDARASERTLIIARTDAIAVEGIAAALDRAESYAEAGAAMLFF